MKYNNIIQGLFFLFTCFSCSATSQQVKSNDNLQWESGFLLMNNGTIFFVPTTDTAFSENQLVRILEDSTSVIYWINREANILDYNNLASQSTDTLVNSLGKTKLYCLPVKMKYSIKGKINDRPTTNSFFMTIGLEGIIYGFRYRNAHLVIYSIQPYG